VSYLVIARKYRPVDFDQVVGQETVVKSLKNALTEDRLSHAYLFSGTRGVGKTTVARILARALNCSEGPTPNPCNKCDSCRDIMNGASLDVIEIDGASNRRVEETQQIIENVQYAPARDRFKVYIIDEVHMLSNHAFNALLKTLEEPPRHVVFILATTEYMKVPQTIRSRTQHFHFPNVPQGTISENLKTICKEEGVSISDKALWLISRQASGSVRDAQSLLDQVIAFSGLNISDEKVENVLGVVKGELLDRFLEAIGRNDSANLISLAAETFDSGYDLGIIIRELIERVRNLLLLKIDKVKLTSITTLSAEDAERAMPLADIFSAPQLVLIFDIFADAENRMKYSSYSRFILETALVKASEAKDIITVSRLLSATGGGQSAVKGDSSNSFSNNSPGGESGSTATKPRITGIIPYKVMNEKEAESFIPSGAYHEKANDSAIIKKILDECFHEKKLLFAKLGGEKLKIKNGTLILLVSHKNHETIRKHFNEDKSSTDFLMKMCKKYLGPSAEFSIEEYIPEDLEKAALQVPEPADKQKNLHIEKLANEPVVQKLLEAFSIDVSEIQVKPYKDSDSGQ
jgi:DNA polymerase-3 subunit gamma/tau